MSGRARPSAKLSDATRRTAIAIRTAVWIAIAALPGAARAADVLLAVPEKAQEHTQWCWSGSSQALLVYYGAGPAQCSIANWSFARTDCCGSTVFDWSHPCNYWNYMIGDSAYGNAGRSLQGILTHWGVTTTAVYSALSAGTSVAEIDAGRPFVIRFGWASGGGHFLVVYGYDQAGTYLDYMDPWPGNGYTKSLYSWTASAPGHHAWTHTLQSTTPPRGRPDLVPYKLPSWSSAIVVSRTTGTHTNSPGLLSTETLYVDWSAFNGGQAPTAAAFTTKLYVDGVLRRTWTRSAPVPAYRAFSGQDFALGPLAAGTHVLKIETDAGRAVSESNELNNAFSRTVTVH